ncbi:MAG: NAD(P)-dependent oxidoreductase [Actinomycetales bacterium]|nr:MAG: NAD(P)-dependent oxidoreductase [Actinomycetales bacterium]
MIIIDTELARREAEGSPVRVALVGGGYMARCIALQFLTAGTGMRLVAIANRTVDKARRAFADAGAPEVTSVQSEAQLASAVDSGTPAVTDDAGLLCRSAHVDVVIEATGHVEFGTQVCFEAITHGKHAVLMGAEVDATVGPILRHYADANGVVFTYTDGDEPGVGMNLARLVSSMGYEPVLMGQLKGFLDHYRNPETQRPLADRLGQNPAVLASFADGSKLALEAAIMGNATGFVPQVRGMHGHACADVKDMLDLFTERDFEHEGLVEYALGAAPHTGAFVICRNYHPEKRKLMAYLKMGDGPLYLFYQPFHLPPWQILHSVARAALMHDPTITPAGAPVCDTVTYAKRDLRAGERLDGMGGFTGYGLVERAEVCQREDFLPIAVSLDCRLVRDVPKDTPIRYADVELPPGRLVDRLREEQASTFETAGSDA